MKIYCVTALAISILCSCTGDSKKSSSPTDVTEKKIDSFFPVTSFIRGQLITLDSMPVTPLQITMINKKTDSVWVPKEKLKPLLMPFLVPEITETNLVKYFTETRFNDQTLNAITFTYDPINTIPDSIELRHWDVYIDPETGYVVKVYIVKKIKENGQNLTQQLTWQTSKMAKITTILNRPGGDMQLVKEVMLLWKF